MQDSTLCTTFLIEINLIDVSDCSLHLSLLDVDVYDKIFLSIGQDHILGCLILIDEVREDDAFLQL